MPEQPPPVPGFESARVLRRLGSGPVSDSWLLGHEGGELVLRRDRPCAARIGLSRDRERRVLKAAHGGALAPELLLANPGKGLLLTRFVPGGTWQERAESNDTGPWTRLGALLRRVHALAPQAVTPFEPGVQFDAYARAAGTPEALVLARELTALARRLYRDAPWVLCHHDPHLGNVVGAEGILIDWEYAALGHPLYDIACIIDHHALEEQAAQALVAGWSGEAPPVALEPLEDFLELVAGVNELWSMAVDACC